MATYAIGDIQGCNQQLQALLRKIQFNPHSDELWLAGDLVNRGPESLQVLRFLTQLPKPPVIVLGNHDLHLLAIYRGIRPLEPEDTINDVLAASDCDELCNWLRQQPLIHHDVDFAMTMVHAGIPPQWSVDEAQVYATEVETVLKSENHLELLKDMYGNEPAVWNEALTGFARLRLIINYFTRMRFCDAKGKLNLDVKTSLADQPQGYFPWYKIPNRKTKDDAIIFGHWAALAGQADTENIYALDSGCVWGGTLTALRLDDKTLFSVPGVANRHNVDL